MPEHRPGTARPETRELAPASRDGSNPEADERVRKIQEEIRRKIAERRGQVVPPPMPAPEREQPGRMEPPPEVYPAPEPVREVVTAYDDSAALERQRRLAEQMEELEARRREARMAAQAAAMGAGSRADNAFAPSNEPSRTAGFRSLNAELRDPRALRRAMVFREVLGAPVALR